MLRAAEDTVRPNLLLGLRIWAKQSFAAAY